MIHATHEVEYAYDVALHCYPGFTPGPTVFHAYWDGMIGLKQVTAIKSLLATQVSYPVRVILWTAPGTLFRGTAIRAFAALRAACPGRIELRPFDFIRDSVGTPLEGVRLWQKTKANASDGVRMVVLYHYGGCWFDLDCLFLRDIGRFLRTDFVYGWEFQKYANTALMHVEAGDNCIRETTETAARMGICHPAALFKYGSRLTELFDVYPCHLFDPLWAGMTRHAPFAHWVDLFARPCAVPFELFFPNSYVFHWHNHWDEPIVSGSYFDVYSREFDHILGIQA